MTDTKVDLSKPLPVPNEVPSDVIPLPSRGKVYPAGSPLCNLESLEIRAMTARDEDILTSRALLKQGKAIDALLRSCIVDKTIDVDSMLTGDRNAALVGIRMTGYGAEYKVKTACSKCDAVSPYEFDLSQIPLKMLEADPIEPLSNSFMFKLPMSKKTVVFRLSTGADERRVADDLEMMRKRGGTDSMVTTRLHSQIISIDGETDRTKLMSLVQTMPARDSRDLRKHIDNVSPGITMRQEVTCPECDESSEVDVPMGTEFFWPSGE